MSSNCWHAADTRCAQVLRLQYEKELGQNHVTVQTRFNYAWGLVKSPQHRDQVEGVKLLSGMSLFRGPCGAGCQC